ncbi:hypothetical protein [Marinomonas sp. THO17]|uniref:DUF7217 family protein n=1 Tax=Marinomonas sp. THO17 TaxID=3149048 RepID=UPI00336C088B
MTSLLNEQLFAILAAGNGFHSSCQDKINQLEQKITQLNTEFNALGTELAPVIVDETQVLTELETARQTTSQLLLDTGSKLLLEFKQQLAALRSHVEERLDQFLDELSVASAIRSLGAYQDLDSGIRQMVGSAFGTLDESLDQAQQLLEQIIAEIQAFDIASVTLDSLAQLNSLLQQAFDQLTPYISMVKGAIAQELAALSQMYLDFKQFSNAVSAQLMIQDASLLVWIEKIATAELKTVLANILKQA